MFNSLKPRDPDRILKILEKIEQLWKKNSDLRLCQLIVAITGETNNFYIEDDDLLKMIEGKL